jgi:GNAT superfamily N-acetyltransferase
VGENFMALQSVDVELSSARLELLEAINTNAFPDSQRIALHEYFPLVVEGLVELKGLLEGDDVVGFYVLIPDEEIRFLSFLAIDQAYRSRGYGSEAIRLICQDDKSRPLTVCIEPIDENSTNNLERVRRKNFYLRNGFFTTGHKQLLNDHYYDVLCSSNDFNITAFTTLMNAIAESN